MADHYEAQLRRLKMEEMDLEAKRRAANLSSKRFANFEAEITGISNAPTVGLIRKRDLALIPFPVPPARTCSDAMNVILRFQLLPRTKSPAADRALAAASSDRRGLRQ
jgi:hypothetical protein